MSIAYKKLIIERANMIKRALTVVEIKKVFDFYERLLKNKKMININNLNNKIKLND
jgi:ribosomal protein S17